MVPHQAIRSERFTTWSVMDPKLASRVLMIRTSVSAPIDWQRMAQGTSNNELIQSSRKRRRVRFQAVVGQFPVTPLTNQVVLGRNL